VLVEGPDWYLLDPWQLSDIGRIVGDEPVTNRRAEGDAERSDDADDGCGAEAFALEVIYKTPNICRPQTGQRDTTQEREDVESDVASITGER